MRIYIAGPMTPTRFDQEPDTSHAYTAFHAAEADLRAAGHLTYNPATNEKPYGSSSRHVYREDNDYKPLSSEVWASLGPEEYARAYREVMSRDIRWILECDGIALLKGWRRSQGAMFEHSVGAILGLYISNVEDFVRKGV